MGNVVRSVWTEPRAPRPPVHVWRDWALVTVFISTAVLEAFLHRDVLWRPVAVGEAVALAFTLPWRRTYPLAVVAAAFGTAIVTGIATIAVNAQGEFGLYTMAYLLVLPYALFRWGSGREAVIGSVAQHVSAMVIRAQAGRVVAESRPVAAVEALEIIEAEGSRTLAEMRTMVGALRGGDDAELAPLGGIADIERLARSVGDQPSVRVSISGVPADLATSVDTARYRIAQEAITNAMRHARHASHIVVRVTGQDGRVSLTVRDDGDQVSTAWAPGGFGIVGMTERAALLGGSLQAGPDPDRGWVVEAMLPAAGSAG